MTLAVKKFPKEAFFLEKGLRCLKVQGNTVHHSKEDIMARVRGKWLGCVHRQEPRVIVSLHSLSYSLMTPAHGMMISAYETAPPHSDWSIGPKPLFTMPSGMFA